MKLLINALAKFLLGLFLTAFLLFLPAGSFQFTNGFLFLALLFGPILILGIVLFFFSPDLLRKRLSGKETEKSQRGIVGFSGLIFILGFVVAGLDFRFGWSCVPNWLVFSSSFVLLASYALYAEVMRENAFLSRTIEVQENQKVVDTGLYGIVRHPMYAATILLFLSIPLVLGSFWSFICFLPYLFAIVKRIQNEEALLKNELEGYAEYQKQVKYKLIPFIW